MSKHTKGPWHTGKGYDDREGRVSYYILSDAGNGCGNRLATIDGDLEREEENAQLIAAAPDLLEACKIALNTPCVTESAIIITSGMDESCEHCNALRKAIAKAEGT